MAPRLKDEPGNSRNYTQNSHYTGTEHICIHEKRWDSFFSWKEKVIDFMAEKRTTNGNLKLEDSKLEKRLTGLENRLWYIIAGLLITFVTVLIK
jgi:hypothetical protein